MSDLRNRDFEDMIDPPLADRLRAFELVLESEECTDLQKSCGFLSSTRRMCPACRLRHRFAHIFYYAENYEGGPGEIPRRQNG